MKLTVFNEKPKRGSNRKRRKATRHYYKEVKEARKAGNFTNVGGMNFTTKAVANLCKYSRQSSRHFVYYYSNVRADQEWNELSRCADY